MKPLLRRPRYCQLVIDHFDEPKRDDDLTVERLLYLDIRDRQGHKASALSEEKLRDVIAQLARKQLDRPDKPMLYPGDLREFDDTTGAIYQDILDGLLVRQPGAARHYKIDRKRLIYGAGMLLLR